MDVTGELIVKGDTQSYGQSGFLKREIVVKTDERYPQTIPVEFVQDKSDLPDPYAIGEQVIISTNLRGREHQGRYYLSLQGWKIQRVPLAGGQTPPPPAPLPNEPVMPKTNEAVAQPAAPTAPVEDEDDIPF